MLIFLAMNIVATLILAEFSVKANDFGYKFDRTDEVTCFIAVWAWMFSAMTLLYDFLQLSGIFS